MIVNQTHPVSIDGSVVIHSFSPDPSPNLLEVTHKTVYQYSSKVLKSKHLFRLQPVSDISQTILNYKCTVSVNSAEVCNFIGAFGNNATFLEIQEPYTELEILSHFQVAVHETPRRLDLLHQPRAMPLIWMPWDRMMMQAYLQPPELPEYELFELAEFAMTFVGKNKNNVYKLLLDLTETIYKNFSYVEGVTSLHTTPYKVFRSRRGVCQDFANLFICLVRLLDIPARYRVGYLLTHADYENRTQADATHAWVEVFCPYAGWIGFDPTNGCMADKNYIKVACGRYFSDATPTSGTIFKAEGDAKETLTTSVKVKELKKPK